jgi:hypothetical protein
MKRRRSPLATGRDVHNTRREAAYVAAYGDESDENIEVFRRYHRGRLLGAWRRQLDLLGEFPAEAMEVE